MNKVVHKTGFPATVRFGPKVCEGEWAKIKRRDFALILKI